MLVKKLEVGVQTKNESEYGQFRRHRPCVLGLLLQQLVFGSSLGFPGQSLPTSSLRHPQLVVKDKVNHQNTIDIKHPTAGLRY